MKDAVPKPAPDGCKTMITPRNPTVTASHLRHPTVSFRKSAERTAMINGDEKVMVVTLASDAKAIAETKQTRSAAETRARIRCRPIQLVLKPANPTVLTDR